MGQEVSVSADINIVNHIIHYDKKKSKTHILRGGASSSDEIKNLKSCPSYPLFNVDAKKACIIFCNSYDHTPYALGDSALNDGILTYYEMVKRDYSVYLYHDTTKEEFKSLLAQSLQLAVDKLVIYYIGHGTQVRDLTGDENDRYDECVVCMNGKVVDDELSRIIMKNKRAKQVVLISDCCHSGTIYDVTPREDIITIGACLDNQTAKQDWIDHRGNGIFTYYFWKYVKDHNDSESLQKKMNVKLAPYMQKCAFSYAMSEVV